MWYHAFWVDADPAPHVPIIGRLRELVFRHGPGERQTSLDEFPHAVVLHLFVPMSKVYDDNQGLSERILRKRLERQGWSVWRGGSIGIERVPDVYPNVKERYTLLSRLLEKHHGDKADALRFLCAVHHGMPDFICFRDGVFKFVECKFKHEPLSGRQRKCIARLQGMGFIVEVHKLVDHRTLARECVVDLVSGHKTVMRKQERLMAYA